MSLRDAQGFFRTLTKLATDYLALSVSLLWAKECMANEHQAG
jgi:hypothetical protein